MKHNPNRPSRRELLRCAGTAGIASLAAPTSRLRAQGSTAAAGASEARNIEPLNRFPRMVQEYFVHRVRAIEDAGNQRRARLKTKADAGSLRPRRAREDPTVLRPLARKDAAQPAHHGRRRARCLQHRKSHLRKPPRLSGNGESVHAQGPAFAAAGGRRHLRPYRQRQGIGVVSVLRAGPGAPGLRRAALRPHRAGRAAAIRR